MSRIASGLRAWVVQRATAVYLGIFGTYLLLHFVFDRPTSHAELQGWVAHPVVALGLLLFIPALLLHAWVGIRDVLMDYAKPVAIRVAALWLVAIIFIASGLWAAQAILLARMG